MADLHGRALVKIDGGDVLGIPIPLRFRLCPKNMAALRAGTVTDEWFARLADACWEATRAYAIARIKQTAMAHVAMTTPSLDRRPSKLTVLAVAEREEGR